MEDKNLGYINDFIDIETYINNGSFETSGYTGVEDFFSEHLEACNINEKMKLDGIDVFRIEIGNKVRVSPSTWTLKFREKHSLEDENSSYDLDYKVENIRIDFFSKDARSDSGLPCIQIRIYLTEA